MTQQTPTPQVIQQQQTHDDEIDLGYLLAVCWDHRKLILSITFLTTALGICYALLATPIYRADALLQVEKQQTGLGSAELQFLMGQEGSASSTQTQILQSRMIMGQAADQVGLDLIVEPNYFPLIGKALVRYGVTRPSFAEGWSSAWAEESIKVDEIIVDATLFEQELTLRVQEGGRFILKDESRDVLGEGLVGERMISDNPRVQLYITAINAPIKAEFTIIKRSPAGATRNLQERFSVSEQGTDSGILELSLTGENPGKIIQSLDAISQVYLVQNINRQAAEAESRLQFLENQAPEIRQALTHSEDELNSYRATQDSVDLSFETQSMLERLVLVESQLNELELHEAELAERFTSSHPSYQTLLDKKAQLQDEKSRMEIQVGNLPETQQQVLRLNRDVEVTQQIYMQMLNTMQELRIARAGTIGNVRILDEALAAQVPISPRRALITVISSLAGLMLGLLVVVIRKMMNRGVETVEQLTEIGLPVYATIPLSDAQVSMTRTKEQGGSALSEKKSRRKPGKKDLGGLLAWSSPADMSIEAIRSLRTSLHFAMLEAGNNRLMLTGPSPAVGKSFVSVNLAAVCAQAGQKVLLIDADLRKGHIHSSFKENSENGLTDVLTGKVDGTYIIRTSKQEGLDYIPRGKVPPNPSELLIRPNFTSFLDEVSSQYDLVIIDTPPVLAVTDAAIVGKQCSTTLMIVRFLVNHPREIERSLQQLERAGVNVKGAIFNAIERSAAVSYGYGYGYYNYSYQAEIK